MTQQRDINQTQPEDVVVPLVPLVPLGPVSPPPKHDLAENTSGTDVQFSSVLQLFRTKYHTKKTLSYSFCFY